MLIHRAPYTRDDGARERVRRAGPLVSIGFDGTSPPDDVLDLLREGDIGGITLFARNVRDAPQTRDLVRALHEARPVPIAVDQEGGSVVRVGFLSVFPSAMALGATRDPALVERVARAVATELRSLGVGVLLAPVCDVNSEARNPVIATRAFSDDPALCAELAAAWVRGAQSAGVACTAKHFPGHGATPRDSHHDFVEVTDDQTALWQRDLPPFRAAIAAGVAQVMTAHVRYPALDERPATYSRAILNGVLRRKLGFDGVICSDALEMRGARLEREVPAVAAIAAGVDIVHHSVYGDYGESIDAIERACVSGAISAERMADALRRARAFASRWSVAPADARTPSDRALPREVAARAITRVGPPLPALRGPIVCAAFSFRKPSPVEELHDPLGVLERALRERFRERLTFVRDPAPGLAVPEDATLVVLTSNAFLDAEQARRAQALAGGHRAVVCALGVPYDALLFPELPALLAYSDVPASTEALAACLAGERAPEGRLPVSLDRLRSSAIS